MWDDVVIGEGAAGCTAVLCLDLCKLGHVSESRTAYWINLDDPAFIPISMRIFKDHPEGRHLSEMIATKVEPGKVYDYLEHLALEHMSAEKLRGKVACAQKRAYQKGWEAKTDYVRKALLGD